MTTIEDVKRARAVQPLPWYERLPYLLALACAAMAGGFAFALLMFSLERV